MTADPTRQLDEEVAGCAAAHQRLHSHLNELLDAGGVDPAMPSLLPGWTVGHVLTHLARNADAFTNMIRGAIVGETRLMYPTAKHREADIEAGSGRSGEALVDDVRQSAWTLESTWSRLDVEAWAGAGLSRLGHVRVSTFPWRRWREVEVHHADLGLRGFTPAEWSTAFTTSDLPRLLADANGTATELPPSVAAAPPWRRHAWLLGRSTGPDLPPAPMF